MVCDFDGLQIPSTFSNPKSKCDILKSLKMGYNTRFLRKNPIVFLLKVKDFNLNISTFENSHTKTFRGLSQHLRNLQEAKYLKPSDYPFKAG